MVSSNKYPYIMKYLLQFTITETQHIPKRKVLYFIILPPFTSSFSDINIFSSLKYASVGDMLNGSSLSAEITRFGFWVCSTTTTTTTTTTKTTTTTSGASWNMNGRNPFILGFVMIYFLIKKLLLWVAMHVCSYFICMLANT